MTTQEINEQTYKLVCYFPAEAVPAQNKSQIIQFIREIIQPKHWQPKDKPQGFILVLEDQFIAGYAKIWLNEQQNFDVQAICAYVGYLGGSKIIILHYDPTCNIHEVSKTAFQVKEEVECYSLFFEVSDYLILDESKYFSLAETGIYNVD